MSETKSLLRDLFTTYATRLFLFPLSLGTSILLARGLGPEGKGLYALAASTVALVTPLAALGVGKALVYHVAGRNFTLDRLSRTSLGLGFVQGGVASVLVLLAGVGIQRFIESGLNWPLILAASALASVSILAGHIGGLIRGLQQIGYLNLISILQGLLFLSFLSVIFITHTISPALAIGGLWLSQAIAGVLLAYKAIQMDLDLKPGISSDIAKGLLGYGGLYLAQNILYLLHQKADIYMIGSFLTSAHIGFYSLAVNMANPLMHLPLAVSFVLVPWLSSRAEQNTLRYTAAIARLTTALSALMAVMITVVAQPLVGWLYGPAFLPAVPALLVLLPGIVMHGLLFVSGSQLLATNRVKPLVWVNGATLILNIALNVFLIPKMGIAGASLASSITYTIAALATTWIAMSKQKSEVKGISLSSFLLLRPSDLQGLFRFVAREVRTAGKASRL